MDPTGFRAGPAHWKCLHYQADGTSRLRERAGGLGIARFNANRAGGRVRCKGEACVVATSDPDSEQQRDPKRRLQTIGAARPSIPGKSSPHPIPLEGQQVSKITFYAERPAPACIASLARAKFDPGSSTGRLFSALYYGARKTTRPSKLDRRRLSKGCPLKPGPNRTTKKNTRKSLPSPFPSK